MAATDQLYPLSDPTGKAIPIDIIRAKGFIYRALTANTALSLTLPATYTFGWVYATVDCVVKFGGTAFPTTLANDTEYADATVIPAGSPLSLILTPGTMHIMSFASGSLYVMSVEQWAAMQLARQVNQG